MVDGGIDPSMISDANAVLQEFTDGDNIADKVQWMFVEPMDFDGPARKDDSATRVDGYCDPSLVKCKTHGTSMLGFVTGSYLGASKNVQPWVVRVPRKREGGGGATPNDWLRGVAMINEKITEKTEVTQAIVSLSWMFGVGDIVPDSRLREWQKKLETEITQLIEKGVFVVTGSGNSAIVSSREKLTPSFPTS